MSYPVKGNGWKTTPEVICHTLQRAEEHLTSDVSCGWKLEEDSGNSGNILFITGPEDRNLLQWVFQLRIVVVYAYNLQRQEDLELNTSLSCTASSRSACLEKQNKTNKQANKKTSNKQKFDF